MKYPHASLADQQVRDTYFIVPELGNIYALALGDSGYQAFKVNRECLRAAGGELVLIGWPDGTTITYGRDDRSAPIDLDNLAATYRASAAMFRVRTMRGAT
jgi:hypothetical protein